MMNPAQSARDGFRCLSLFGLGVLFAVAHSAWAFGAAPQMTGVSPRGFQVGATTHMIVHGSGLDQSLRVLITGVDGVQTHVVSCDGERAELQVSVPRDVAPGLYPLRLISGSGVTNAVAVGVDELPQLSMRDTVVSLPVALHGTLRGADRHVTEFVGQAGQRLVVDVEGRRLGASIRPVLRLYSPDDRQLAIAQPTSRLAGDTRLELTLPIDGIYRIELQDLLLQGPEPGWFRMKIGDLDYVDAVYPLASNGGEPQTLEVLRSGAVEAVEFAASQVPTKRVMTAPWPAGSTAPLTAASPVLRVDPWGPREWREEHWRGDAEQPATSEARLVSIPWAMNGRLLAAGEVDEYELPLAPRTEPVAIRCEVFADRWGSPLDTVLELTDPAGNSLGQNDDQPGSTDPMVEATLPPELKLIRVRVSSLTGNYGPDAAYRVLLSRKRDGQVELKTEADRVHVPSGGRVVLPVEIVRQGAAKQVRLSIPAALSPALRLETPMLEPTDEIGLVSLAADSATQGLFQFPLHFADADSSLGSLSSLVTGAFPGTQYRPHWREELVVAVMPTEPLAVQWQAVTAAYLARGVKQPMRLHMQHTASSPLRVRLSLLTSQRTPQKQQNNQTVEDPSRALRLVEVSGEPREVPPGSSLQEFTLHVPADLPLHPWAMALRADVLSESDQTLATVYSAVKRLPTIAPLGLSVEWPEKLELKKGAEEPMIVHGRVMRHPDFRAAVKLTAVGLGDAESQSDVMVSAEQSEFQFEWKIAAGATAREVQEVRLRAEVVEVSEAWSGIQAVSAPVTVVIQE
jgi:hypothetical protein